jgi:hypothetical protein
LVVTGGSATREQWIGTGMTAPSSRTRWGGIIDDPSPPRTGFFRLDRSHGGWWLIDPDGGRFLSKGVTTVRFDQDQIQNTDRVPYAEACRNKYGGKPEWREAAARRLSSWGFNTLGAWSDEAVARAGSSTLALVPNLDIGLSFTRLRKPGWPAADDAFPDVFDPDFDRHARERAREMCSVYRDDRAIIGWFSDNELRWGPDWRGTDELLTIFLNLAAVRPGRRAAVAMLRERYGQWDDCNAVWRTTARSWDELATLPSLAAPYASAPLYQRNVKVEREQNAADPKRAAFFGDCDAFMGRVAQAYFETTTATIKAADPNHLAFGCRFAYVPQHPVIAAAGRHLDVISFNCYEPDPGPAIDAFAMTDKPCLIGEFSFRGRDSGLPNTIGAGPLVPTQADRARCFHDYVVAALNRPCVVGYHWFEHADQPAEGRFDGENSNFGTVSIKDDVYEELTQAMTALNARAEEIHAAQASALA